MTTKFLTNDSLSANQIECNHFLLKFLSLVGGSGQQLSTHIVTVSLPYHCPLSEWKRDQKWKNLMDWDNCSVIREGRREKNSKWRTGNYFPPPISSLGNLRATAVLEENPSQLLFLTIWENISMAMLVSCLRCISSWLLVHPLPINCKGRIGKGENHKAVQTTARTLVCSSKKSKTHIGSHEES